ncbi:isoprenylcysteine carboxylmethyltransferase family protein [candidate division KSB1 bacterium]|nr:isoprenylcysteine carboxylmethyltransferase family protein [candidate division KSB1 bacterium]RQW03415.1 MAG: isoprenylcysteine carboxylmethyltransferase family protein [candidate division KSB1 bacterium]
MFTSFLIWFGLCFVCYLLRTIFEILKSEHAKIASVKGAGISIYAIMAILWFSWFQMCIIDPEKIFLPRWLRYVGLFFFTAGIFLFILSHRQMKGFKHRGFIVKNGLYSRIRNPMYLGFTLWVIGFPLFLQKLYSLYSAIIWITFILIWKALEEKELERKYPDYQDYKKKTWF